MDNRANEAYLTAIIDGYERKLDKKKGLAETTSTLMLKEVVVTLNDLSSFMRDKQSTDSKSTLELNADLRNNARAYQEDLAEKESTIETLSMNLGGLGYIEQENMILEADNLKLNNQLTLQKTKRKELFVECCEAEIENGKYIMEIQTLNKENLELKSRLAMTSVSERTIRELKADNQFCEAICIEQREKIEKLTGPHWITD